ncbi:MAG: peptidoglycan editing factor PgeF [Hyphomicrobiaceae bacterium]|nr:peptidoglycan editing factor PgeF [Hyphomicrobiaceae bacterium]
MRIGGHIIDGRVFEAENLTALPGVRHGFFTRQGGVSGGVYASLNCGYGSDDDRDAVTENRRRIASHLGATHPNVLTVYQIHSAQARVVEAPFAAADAPKADALVTATPGLAIGALAADCTPVLFADAEARVIGAAHAGWRGALSGILEATLDAMVGLGAQRDRIATAIGPTIHQPSYEVGEEFLATFVADRPDYVRFFERPRPGAKPHFDLPGFCAHRLAEAGIANVAPSPACTYANESLLFSYRRKTHLSEPDYGRQISAIVLE